MTDTVLDPVDILQRVLRCLTSMLALTGMLHCAVGLGMSQAPAEMRLPEKMALIGAPLGTALGSALNLAIGLGKVGIAVNNWSLKSSALDRTFALVSVPGFAFVLWVHRNL